jgi:hypothetical protein
MGLRPVSVRAFLFLIACTGVSGCAVVDQYSGRATVYNAEAEEAHNQGLLLNIVRASLRHPRQFTIVQKITGTAQAQGSLNLAFPFGSNASSTPGTAILNGGASGGPSFDVAPLETSDFYEGLAEPFLVSCLTYTCKLSSLAICC